MKLIHEGINQSPMSTFMFITHFITKLGEVRSAGWNQGSRIAPTVQLKRWIPPTAGHAKINVDAVVSHGVGSVAVV